MMRPSLAPVESPSPLEYLRMNVSPLLRTLITGAVLAVAVGASTAEPAEPITPGALWPDNRGQPINAHGGGVIRVGETWYWFGEYRPEKQEPGRRSVSCYSSTDLAHWKFRGVVFDSARPEGIGAIGDDKAWVLERPKVFHNARTGKYVMYMHLDEPHPQRKGYHLALVGVAVSDTVDGDYRFVRAFRPLGKESRDIGQFIDDDGTAYLIFESRPTQGFCIAKLSDDYLDVAEETCFIQSPLEGGALVHYQGLYYIIGSALSGWSPNPNKYATAKSLKGPWSEFKDIAPPETKTYRSQSTNLVKVVGSKRTTVVYLGDQWRPKTQWDSRYLWMPLEIGDGKLWLPEPRPWSLDVKTGEVTFLESPGKNAPASR